MWIVLGLAVAAALLMIVIYNRLVALRQNCGNAYSDIDVQLSLRTDLIPNLVETVRGYAGHEKETLQNVTEARARAMSATTPGERADAESALTGALVRLNAVAESYPDLKANQNFMELQRELSDIENKIAAARRFLNSAVNEYNTAIQQFPAVLIARQFGFDPQVFFEVDEQKQLENSRPPEVKFS